MINKIIAFIERVLSLGISTCSKCNRPWKTNALKRTGPNTYTQLQRMRFYGLIGVESHHTFYTKSRGCFALCESCWQSLSITDRIPHYMRLCDIWELEGDDYSTERKLILEAVLRGE